eukprot:14199-Heterococcus_DN1.PRE.1
MGTQMQNKLARLCVPDSTTPCAAKHMTLTKIPKRRGLKNMIAYNDILAQHVGLKEGYRRHSDSAAKDIRLVTGDYLDAVIQQHFDTADDETIANLQSPKNCLLNAAEKLQESLSADIS